MNFNDNPEKLEQEEQAALNKLITQMNQILKSLDQRMKNYVFEARNADISINPDAYLGRLLAQQGKKNTVENRKKLLQSRDELYHTRLLLQYENIEDSGIDEVKVGLHSCTCGDKTLVTAWTMPLCRHYLLDNASTEFETIVKGTYGRKYHTNYKLLVKNRVTLNFTRVVKALNLFPGIFDDKTLELIKGTGFLSDAYLDKMIERFNPDAYDPNAAAKIISDEFLQELLERRSTPEFKNIVFSIQKKQGEIIQAPYRRNMVVQGCAGSGKSMIMLHRLPILLYDNPNSLSRTSLYIITPSQMYIQLAGNMRNQLEISDINMGTIEEYYDYCISKYPGYKPAEYGKINYTTRISLEDERYVYSQKCIEDICQYYDGIGKKQVPLEKAYFVLRFEDKNKRPVDTYAQRINDRILKLQKVITTNTRILKQYFAAIESVIESLETLRTTLSYRKRAVLHEIDIITKKREDEIAKAEKELKNYQPGKNEDAINNRRNIIESARNQIVQLQEERDTVDQDEEYFLSLIDLSEKVSSVIALFSDLKKEFNQNSIEEIYDAVGKIGQLIGGFYMLSWESSKIEDKYQYYLDAIKQDVEAVEKSISSLQGKTGKYLEYNYYKEIELEADNLKNENTNAVKNAYKLVLDKIGITERKNGNIKAVRCSPYIYLQAIYCYQGAPQAKENLLAIDEVQGLAVEELKLLNTVNDKNVIFNMFGDINQHIEGTKGVDCWDEYRGVVDFDLYEMKENYRNASQITEYCNKQFAMDMKPINTPGKGVHELKNESEFVLEMITQLMDTQRVGLAAILVGDRAEAQYLLDKFSTYEQKFHDMTDEDFSIHRTRWNIIHIDDAKGLEFSSVIVLSGRMSRNQKYIAYTRALDDLYVYSEVIDITGYQEKSKKKLKKADNLEKTALSDSKSLDKPRSHHKNEKVGKNYDNSEVRKFFEESGLKVIDTRSQGGRLWVIGEKAAIKSIVDSAIATFGISGKYASSKEINNRNGWCTKTEK